MCYVVIVNVKHFATIGSRRKTIATTSNSTISLVIRGLRIAFQTYKNSRESLVAVGILNTLRLALNMGVTIGECDMMEEKNTEKVSGQNKF